MICTGCLNAGVRIQYVKKQPQIFPETQVIMDVCKFILSYSQLYTQPLIEE
jgi:hypothetical protein